LPFWLVSGSADDQGAKLCFLLQSPFVMPAKSATLGCAAFYGRQIRAGAEFMPLGSNLPAVLSLGLGANDKFELGVPCRVIKFKSNVSANFRCAKFKLFYDAVHPSKKLVQIIVAAVTLPPRHRKINRLARIL